MQLNKLKLHNFRCFADLEVDLHPKLTVIVAENGQGKSSILDAIRIGLWPFVSSFDLAHSGIVDPGNGIAVDDVRLAKLSDGEMARQLPASVSIEGDFGAGSIKQWTRYRDKEAKATKTKDADDTSFMKQWVSAVQDQIRDPNKPTLSLPVFGYYGTGRLWAQKKLTESGKGKDDTKEKDFFMRTFAYRNCLDPASTYKHFREWFIWASESYLELQIKANEKRADMDAVKIAGDRVKVVQQAIDMFLQQPTGWHGLEFSVSRQKSLILHHDEYGVLEVEQMSDGIRSVLAMIGDIAYRCIKLNPHYGKNAAVATRGVVMIDEIDMHIHPRWQQIILTQLQKAFPAVQFIVTTHSPQVLSAVRRECIRTIGIGVDGEFHAEPPLAKTYGEPSGDVLHSVMMVDPQPPIPEKPDLQRLTMLVDQGQYDSEDALELLQQLTSVLGEQHPQLQRLLRSIERQKALKR